MDNIYRRIALLNCLNMGQQKHPNNLLLRPLSGGELVLVLVLGLVAITGGVTVMSAKCCAGRRKNCWPHPSLLPPVRFSPGGPHWV